jgi:sugar phosphate isomerase/epimerase
MSWRGAFSTLGCAGVPLDDVVELACSGGWSGLEFRAASGEPVHVGLSAIERDNVRRVLREAELTALAVASYTEVDDPAVADADSVADVLAHVCLAHDIGASFVRVFPGGPSGNGAAVRRLTMVAERLDDYPEISVAVETHDSCRRGADLARVLEQVGDGRIRAIWDMQHPWLAGEPIPETARTLIPLLGYVQISDVRSAVDPSPCLLGTGALPLRLGYDVLQDSGYEGWVSLEWPSYWYPEAPPLAEALPGAQQWLAGTLWAGG